MYGRPRSIGARIRLVSFLIAAGSITSSCGLEEYVYLGPPVNVYQSGTTLHFENNTENDPLVFRGYRAVYRFYESDSQALLDRGTVDSMYSSSPTTIFSKLLSTLGYRELLLDGQPLLTVTNPLERDDPFEIEISFDSRNTTGVTIGFAPSSATVATSPGLSCSVTRSVGASEEDGFSDLELFPNSTDLKEGQYTEISPTTYMQCYVLAYGISTANGVTEVYSQPIWFNGSLISLPVDVD